MMIVGMETLTILLGTKTSLSDCSSVIIAVPNLIPQLNDPAILTAIGEQVSNKYLSHCIVSRYYDLVYLVALGAEPLPKLLKFSNLQLPPTTSFLSARTAGTTSGEKLCMHNCKYLVQQLLVG